MAHKAFIVHGHFYQPPREDPITGEIPLEPNASPYPNWNERIHAECYRPNAELNNFEVISFNVGPTLHSWLEAHHPGTCRRILEQDRVNVNRYGVGNAIAQAYNHTILPLASFEDKQTQIYWGIADFEHRFGRKPQGMWLPEAAVDTETLTVLARMGIEFTILAPWQASVDGIDVSEPYIIRLPGNGQITVFFYQGELSGRVSFDPYATTNADRFVRQVLSTTYSPDKAERGEDQVLLIASDGELYGHHQYHRERFLARLMDGAVAAQDLQPTYPALWLRMHPPRQEMGIRENTSWSCHHGVARWSRGCSCTPQDSTWKAHLSQAFKRLAGELDNLYLEALRATIPQPWLLRQRYIHVLLGQMSLGGLLNEMAGQPLTSEQIFRTHMMLEMQRERQRMFTSCGWFFEDFDRIEPKNNLAYAAQAVFLARLATGVDLQAQTLADLRAVVSPLTGLSADQVFEGRLRRAEAVHGERVGFAD